MINLIIHRNNTTAYIPLPAGRDNTLKRTDRFLNQKASRQSLKSEKINYFLKKQ